MSATGVLLTYQKQMTSWADLRGLKPVTASASALPVSELLTRVAVERPGKPTAVTWRSGAGSPVEIVFGREGRVFVDPATGAVLGTGSPGTRAFFQKVTEWHRWLAQSGEKRERGGMITGAANFAFLILIVSGFYLWWPRNWSLRALRNITLFRRGLSPKASDFNWHNVVGFWSLVPLFIIVLSGVVISYRWAGDLVYRVVGESPPAREAAPRTGEAAARTREAASAAVSPRTAPSRALPAGGSADYSAMFAQAQTRMENWRTITLQIPSKDAKVVSFSIDRGMGGEPHKRAQLKFDRATGLESEWAPFSAGTPGRKARSILRFAHTGEIGGVPGQTLAGIVSLGATILVWTGFALAFRRLIAWKARAKRGRDGDVSPRDATAGDVSRAERLQARHASRGEPELHTQPVTPRKARSRRPRRPAGRSQ